LQNFINKISLLFLKKMSLLSAVLAFSIAGQVQSEINQYINGDEQRQKNYFREQQQRQENDYLEYKRAKEIMNNYDLYIGSKSNEPETSFGKASGGGCC